jgi:hypothetical protein
VRGEKIIMHTGDRSRSAGELGKQVSKGLYMMYGIDAKGNKSGEAIVVPVLR